MALIVSFISLFMSLFWINKFDLVSFMKIFWTALYFSFSTRVEKKMIMYKTILKYIKYWKSNFAVFTEGEHAMLLRTRAIIAYLSDDKLKNIYSKF